MFDFIVDFDYDVVGGFIMGVDLVVMAMLYAVAVWGWCFDVFVVCKEGKVHGL